MPKGIDPLKVPINPFDPNANPTPRQIDWIIALRRLFKELDKAMAAVQPENKYADLAKHYLEISAMFAIKAVTHHSKA